MLIRTSRFGQVDVQPEDILRFPEGLFGLPECRHWVLLADAENEAIGWLQCTSRPDVALAVVSPRRFVAGYQLRIPRSEAQRMALADPKAAQVLVIVSKHDGGITLNLKAPLVIHLSQRLGRQTINNADVPVRYVLPPTKPALRKIA